MSAETDTGQQFRQRVRSAHDVAARIQDGDSIVVSGGASQPVAFLEALGRRTDLRGVTLYTAMTLVPPSFLVRQYMARSQGRPVERRIRFCSFQPGPGVREAMAAGVVDLVPINTSEVRAFVQNHRVDVLVLGSSGPDPRGGLNYSCTLDWLPDVLEVAVEQGSLIIAETNPTLPLTMGDTQFSLDRVDHIIESTVSPPDMPLAEAVPVASAIGGFLTTLVPDGATLQIGMGNLALRSCLYLESKRGLKVYSDHIGDAFLYLQNKGAVIGGRRADENPWIGSFVLGTRRLYRLVNNNPGIQLRPISTLASLAEMSAVPSLVSISEAACVDLTGQICADVDGVTVSGNPGTAHKFHRGASLSRGGMGIVLLESTDPSGRQSRIVPQLHPGAAVSIPRADVDTVVSEYGVARLRGKSSVERALSLIAVAHPSHRDRLASEARALGLFD